MKGKKWEGIRAHRNRIVQEKGVPQDDRGLVLKAVGTIGSSGEKNYLHALRALTKLEAKYPNTYELYIHKLLALFLLKRYNEAQSLVKNFHSLFPHKSFPDIWMDLAKIYGLLGSFTEMEYAYNKLIELDHYADSVRARLLDLYNLLGEKNFILNNFHHSYNYYKKCCGLMGINLQNYSSKTIEPSMVDVFVKWAILESMISPAHESSKMLKAVIKQYPNNYHALCEIATYYGGRGWDVEKASEYFNKAFAVESSEKYHAWFRSISLLITQKRYEEAIQYCDKYLNVFSDSSQLTDAASIDFYTAFYWKAAAVVIDQKRQCEKKLKWKKRLSRSK